MFTLRQLYGHRAVWRGGARLREGLPDREDKRWEANSFIVAVIASSKDDYFLNPFSLLYSPEHKHFLKNAQLELKKSKRKDYYKVLGVDKNATEDEIKKAYRKRVLLHHPGA